MSFRDALALSIVKVWLKIILHSKLSALPECAARQSGGIKRQALRAATKFV